MKLKSRFLEFLFIIGLLTLRFISTPTADISYLLVAAYAFMGRTQAIQALALSWFFTMVNPGIAAESSMASLGRYLVLFSAALSIALRSGVFGRGGFRIKNVTLSVFSLGTFFAVHSLIVSPMVDVSLLKVISWTLTVAAVISAWAGLTEEERERLSRGIFLGLFLVMLVSLPLVIFPVGYLFNGTGFQGVLNQPQVFGATMAILGAWSAARMIGDRSPSWLVIGLVVACLAMILMSEARIAGVSIVLGLFAAVFTVSAGGRRSIKFSFPGLRSKKVMLVAALAVGGLGLAAGKAESLATHFISKSGRAEATSLLAAYQGSRGGLIGEMWQNIKEKPFTGIGFGIASDVHEMNVQRDPLLGLPLGAPIEKGVLPVAVLEEVGLFGLGFVVAWLWSFLRYWIRGGVVPVSVGLTILLLNMGEATLFSPGGMGLLSLILIGWVVACGQRGAEAPQRYGVSKAH